MDPASAALATLLALALGAWAGAASFWTFAATPVLFRRLPRELAGLTTRLVFPHYYLLGLFLTTVALGALAGWTLTAGGWSTPQKGIFALVSLSFLLLLASRLALLPAMERHREGRERGDAEAARAWGKAHGLSVVANLASLALTLASAGLLAWALA